LIEINCGLIEVHGSYEETNYFGWSGG